MKGVKMNCLEMIMSIINAAGENKLGRTAIQKLSYFVSKKGIINISFSPYYYGPYSSVVSAALMDLQALDFIREDIKIEENLPYDWRKYEYSPTKDGSALARHLERSYKETKIIKEVVSLAKEYTGFDTKILSAAAKTHFILEREMKPMTVEEINKKAENLEWELQPSQIQKAIDFLFKLGLIEKQ